MSETLDTRKLSGR